ncbi:iS66 family element transposase [Bacteroides sp. CAG:545]|nr:iS66 family element transposase [Bacteroides sp. CAG:545]
MASGFSAKRVKESYPVILVFEKWMKDTYPTVLPKSRICQAIEYTFTLLQRLSRYVNDGRISIDNNPVERAIRPLALEEKTGSSAAMMPPHIAQQ